MTHQNITVSGTTAVNPTPKPAKQRFQLNFNIQEIDNGFLITTNRPHHDYVVDLEPAPMKFIETLKDLEQEVILMVTKEKMGFNNV